MPPLQHPADHVAPAEGPSGDHRVEFFDTDAALIESVLRFQREALIGGVAINVATADHRAAVSAALRDAGVDVGAAVDAGRLVMLDAEETLERLLVDGAPDAAAFAQVIGGVLDQAALHGGPVRVFGEMVAVLWQRGSVEAAMTLEDLWNRRSAHNAFRLLCAYPSALFSDAASAQAFSAVCGHHTSASLPADRRPAAQAVQWQLPPALTSGGQARTQLRELLDAWQLLPVLDEAELLASELINNVVMHAGTPVLVCIQLRGAALRIEVSDVGASRFRHPEVDVDAVHGRGLMLVDAVSAAWGTQIEADVKTIWFELTLHAA